MRKLKLKKIRKSKINKIVTIVFIVFLVAGIVWLVLNKKTTETTLDLSFVQEVENINAPTFPDNTCDVSDYFMGKVTVDSKDEKFWTHSAFKEAIEDCANKGGGTVKVPAGKWKVGGPIHLKSNINLYLEEGAVISFSTNPEDFLPVVKTRYTGLELYNYSPMIYAPDCENIAITGKGTIRGISEPNGWQDFIHNKKKAEKRLYKMANNNTPVEERNFGTVEDSLRTSLIQPYNCNNVLIEGIKIEEGPMWTLHAVYTNNLIIRNVTIETEGPNTDGIVVDSSTNVLIENNHLATGDDAIAIKSGRDRDAWRVGKPSQNIIVRNNKVTEAHAGVAIGSEMSGDIRNVLIENLNIEQADRGIRIKSRPGRGGIIENILVQNSKIKNGGKGRREPLQINLNYGSKTNAPKTTKEPKIRNVEFRNIEIESQKQNIIEITGLENRMSSILFKDISIKANQPFASITETEYVRFENVSDIVFKINNSNNLEIVDDTCPVIEQEESKKISVDCDEK